MSKTLSEELCKICGIEAKQIEKRCKECNLKMEECGCFDCYKEVYPDFEQPENFVRLLEILYDTFVFLSDIGLIYRYENPKNLKDDILIYVIKTINGECGYSKKCINELKQAIRSADWKWG